MRYPPPSSLSLSYVTSLSLIYLSQSDPHSELLNLDQLTVCFDHFSRFLSISFRFLTLNLFPYRRSLCLMIDVDSLHFTHSSSVREDEIVCEMERVFPFVPLPSPGCFDDDLA